MHRLLTALGVLAAVASTAVGSTGEDVVVRETRILERSLVFPSASAARKVVVDNLHGSIVVRGTNGDRVEMKVRETVLAEDSEAAARARREVELDVTSGERGIELYVDGPFRCRCRSCDEAREEPDCRGRRWSRSWRDPGYEVVYDVELEVPRGVELELATVNRGEIEVRGVRGRFLVSNVNGGVELEGVVGSGKATTVNGPIEVSFFEPPDGDSRFETVNGSVDLRFPAELSADFDLTTRWGELYSEFPVRSLPSPPPTRRREDGRLVIRSGSGTRLRVAEGGPTVTVETLNGNVYLRERGQER